MINEHRAAKVNRTHDAVGEQTTLVNSDFSFELYAKLPRITRHAQRADVPQTFVGAGCGKRLKISSAYRRQRLQKYAAKTT
jgi:hypothetical protein